MAKEPIQPQDKYVLRLPDGMRDRLKLEADKSGRSMNAEIVARLEESLEVDPVELIWRRTYPSIAIDREDIEALSLGFSFAVQDYQLGKDERAKELLKHDLEYTTELVRILQGDDTTTLERAEQLGAMSGRRFLRSPVGGLPDNPFAQADPRHTRFIAGYESVVGDGKAREWRYEGEK